MHAPILRDPRRPAPTRIQSPLAPASPGPATFRLRMAAGTRVGRWGHHLPAGLGRCGPARVPGPLASFPPSPSPPSRARFSAAPGTYPASRSGAPHAATGPGASDPAALRALPPGEGQGAGSQAPAQHPGHFLPSRPAPLPERPPSRLAPLGFPGSVAPSRAGLAQKP